MPGCFHSTPRHTAIDNRPVSDELVRLVDRWERGDRAALDEMLPAIYAELKRLARLYLRRERADHTLQPTALVHEAYMTLVAQRQVDWRNRAQFLGVAAGAMRRVLLHHAETRNAQKRQGALEAGDPRRGARRSRAGRDG